LNFRSAKLQFFDTVSKYMHADWPPLVRPVLRSGASHSAIQGGPYGQGPLEPSPNMVPSEGSGLHTFSNYYKSEAIVSDLRLSNHITQRYPSDTCRDTQCGAAPEIQCYGNASRTTGSNLYPSPNDHIINKCVDAEVYEEEETDGTNVHIAKRKRVAEDKYYPA